MRLVIARLNRALVVPQSVKEHSVERDLGVLVATHFGAALTYALGPQCVSSGDPSRRSRRLIGFYAGS